MNRRQALAAAGIALAGCADADVGGTGETRVATGPDHEAAEAAIVERINAVRSEEHAGTLNVDAPLERAAREHSQDMHERDFYAHRNPDGQEPWDRVLCEAAETIHRGEIGRMENEGGGDTWQTSDPQELGGYVVEGWTLSRDHYQVMLDGAWRAMGVGVAIEDGEFFATAKFC